MDLVCLVADKNTEESIKALLERHPALGTRAISARIFVHPESDPGCLLHGADFMRPFVNRFSHALVILDREGCGREDTTREELESRIESEMIRAGWGNRAAAIVIDPELESWVWSDSPHVASVLGWERQGTGLRAWLGENGFRISEDGKPESPKEAMEKVLRRAFTPRSSALYQQLARKVSFRRCADPAFARFKTVLRQWFPPE